MKIKDDIEGGPLSAHGRLPAERDLAVMFGVSSVTARRAVTELVEEGLVERRPALVRTYSPTHFRSQRSASPS